MLKKQELPTYFITYSEREFIDPLIGANEEEAHVLLEESAREYTETMYLYKLVKVCRVKTSFKILDYDDNFGIKRG